MYCTEGLNRTMSTFVNESLLPRFLGTLLWTFYTYLDNQRHSYHRVKETAQQPVLHSAPKLGFLGPSQIGLGGRTHGDWVSEGQPVKAQGNEALKWTSYIYGAYLYILFDYKV